MDGPATERAVGFRLKDPRIGNACGRPSFLLLRPCNVFSTTTVRRILDPARMEKVKRVRSACSKYDTRGRVLTRCCVIDSETGRRRFGSVPWRDYGVATKHGQGYMAETKRRVIEQLYMVSCVEDREVAIHLGRAPMDSRTFSIQRWQLCSRVGSVVHETGKGLSDYPVWMVRLGDIRGSRKEQKAGEV